MGRWFAANRDSRESALGVVDAFEVTCVCGGLVAGDRQPNYQLVRCGTCGSKVFVLPENCYPRQRPKAPPKPTRSEPGRGKGVEQDREDAAEAGRASVPTTRRSASDVSPKGRPLAVAPSPKLWTPFRGLVVGIAGVVLVTTMFLWSRHQRQTARATLPAAVDRGLAAFREGDVVLADRELGKAVRAIDLLGLDDPSANVIRQHAREARAAAGLLTDPLPEILRQWAEQSSPSAQQAFARRSLAGQWIICDAGFVPFEDGEGSTGKGNDAVWAIDLAAVAGNRPVVVLARSSDRLPLAKLAERGTTRVVLAAAIEKVSAPADPTGPVRIYLDPGASFLWSHGEHLSVLQFAPEEEAAAESLEALLSEQSRLIGTDAPLALDPSRAEVAAPEAP